MPSQPSAAILYPRRALAVWLGRWPAALFCLCVRAAPSAPPRDPPTTTPLLVHASGEHLCAQGGAGADVSRGGGPHFVR